jgi:Domain of unknown function (DUF397)
MTDLSGAIWRKASGSAHNGGCVEVAGNLPGVTAIRDSKRPRAGVLVIGQPVFAAFLTEVRRGRYDRECSAETPARQPSAKLNSTPRRPAAHPGNYPHNEFSPGRGHRSGEAGPGQ